MPLFSLDKQYAKNVYNKQQYTPTTEIPTTTFEEYLKRTKGGN